MSRFLKPYIDCDVIESLLKEIEVLEKAIKYVRSSDCENNIKDKIDIIIQQIESMTATVEVLENSEEINDFFADLFVQEKAANGIDPFSLSEEELFEKYLDDHINGLNDNDERAMYMENDKTAEDYLNYKINGEENE